MFKCHILLHWKIKIYTYTSIYTKLNKKEQLNSNSQQFSRTFRTMLHAINQLVDIPKQNSIDVPISKNKEEDYLYLVNLSAHLAKRPSYRSHLIIHPSITILAFARTKIHRKMARLHNRSIEYKYLIYHLKLMHIILE